MQKLINHVDQTVRETLEGLVMATDGVALLGSSLTVIRSDADARRDSRVAILSGGGAGHEPAHAGYVGSGLLTAAVSGDVFTSPSTDAVYDAVMSVGGEAGVLLVVKNYTGDILNFGLAAQLAAADGVPVRTVVVRDDVALINLHGDEARRGLAGTVLVHKVAGAVAEAGGSLDDVADAAQAAADGLWTMGVGLGPCTVPAAGTPNFTFEGAQMELGLGIHGEAGVTRTDLAPADEVVETLLDSITAAGDFGKDSRVALLVNGLGATPSMELSIVTRAALNSLAERGIVVERVWTGNFLTALDMPGCSLTLLSVDNNRLALLDAPARSAAWVQAVAPASLAERVLEANVRPRTSSGNRVDASANSAPTTDADRAAASTAAALLEAACAALLDAEHLLTEMDQIVGDGDLGISLARGAKAIRAEVLPGAADRSAAETLRLVSTTLSRVIGGTSGPLYASLLLGAARTLGQGDASEARLAEAFSTAVGYVTNLGGATVGDRTMMDALIPAAEAFASSIHDGASTSTALASATRAAVAGAESTAAMTALKGRSRYLGERAVGTADPGAQAVAIWLAAVSAELNSRG
ncbi:dihydroxyacetone kinase family protein [Lysinibacter cavernae]|uniref:Dihydroxyacetone kinase n=1 Tax=Lysinibacter cavernae TaxID=1640652 RepID=A0A7X5R3H1_9MICO|nr:dihydroxyacetone kinase family protein [Lysinibacter cavernae]NIH54931.1 dihydroxyacetone kinase [Lysinibacter cavernae]